MDDGELYEGPEDWGDRRRCFVLTGFSDRRERLSLENKIRGLGGELLYDVTWNDHITHVISKSFASTELVLGGKISFLLNNFINLPFLQGWLLEDGFSKKHMSRTVQREDSSEIQKATSMTSVSSHTGKTGKGLKITRSS